MNNQEPSDETLRTLLRELQAKWLAQSQEADLQGKRLSVGSMQQAFYQRGIAEGLRLALADVQKLSAKNAENATIAVTDESYVFVTSEAALALLGEAGIHITELHQHEDHTFSAILPPLQVFSFEERLDKLRATADIIILATGKLPNSNKSYVDFAFTTAYSR